MLENPETDKIKVKSLYKALLILEEFMAADTYLGVNQIAEALQLPKSTVSNVLSVYESRGFVKRDAHSGKFKLGIKALELSNHTYQTNDVRRILQPFMQELGRYSMENVLLATYNGGGVVYIGAVHEERTTFNGRYLIGVRAPVYCTGVGKAMLAFLGEKELRWVLEKGLRPFTENTITDEAGLRRELETIRGQGYAVDNMEHEFGIKCVAVPVRDSEGEVVAGLSISGPSLRMSEEKIQDYSRHLMDAVHRASGMLI
jgi:DNA-binding IclR family transcriptional regulator